MRKSVDKANDLAVEKELKKMDSCAVALYFIIPVSMGVLGGEKTKSLIIPVLFAYSWLYIIAFRSFTKSFSTIDIRSTARLSKKYYAHNISWVFFALTGFAIIKTLF